MRMCDTRRMQFGQDGMRSSANRQVLTLHDQSNRRGLCLINIRRKSWNERDDDDRSPLLAFSLGPDDSVHDRFSYAVLNHCISCFR
ncbi:hypothetical protein G6F68_020175 [Rhizopus microsporus]|nr:hypothetical protein G6F68_020175 [Rhizopus microsporus]